MEIPDVVPPVTLTGSVEDKVRAIDAAIADLVRLRVALGGKPPASVQRSELYGPHINDPVWPWTVAGWSLAFLFLILFLVTWLRS
jgi:hypothetical protein